MSLPFQAAAGGSQTSILISESLDGLMVAATRQNVGRSLYAGSPGCSLKENEAGGVKAPGVTEAAIVIEVCGSESLERSSQAAAGKPRAQNSKADAANKVGEYRGSVIILLLQPVQGFAKRTERRLPHLDAPKKSTNLQQ
jgi:hypothetical protein